MLEILYHNQSACGKSLFVQKTLPIRHEVPYVYAPHALLKDCASYPLAVGVWIIIGRLNKQQRGGVPLSAADLATYMGFPKDHKAHRPLRASVMRAIDRLHTLGWFQIGRSTGTKHTLLCTWGQCHRPWDFSQPSTGRPAHVRGVQVPIALCDLYIGSITPQTGREAAQVRRYFTQPLLDLKDIGTYALIRYVIVAPTPRLRHLRLADSQGVYAPLALNELQARLNNGQLTTLDDQENVIILGHRDQGWTAPRHFFSPQSGSTSRSTSGSQETVEREGHLPHGEAQTSSMTEAQYSACMDDHSMIPQLINSTTADINYLMSGGSFLSEDEFRQQSVQTNKMLNQTHQSLGDCEKNHQLQMLDPLIVANHQALNGERRIPSGEWWELTDLAVQHGVKQILIWQARAARSPVVRPAGVTPAYYVACAGREALAAYRAPRAGHKKSRGSSVEPQETPIQPLAQPRSNKPSLSEITSRLDPERLQIVADIEAQAGERIVVRDTLGGVSISVLKAWRDREVVRHPGLAVKFQAPLNFIVGELKEGRMPPSDQRLERWYVERQCEPVDDYVAAFHAYEVKDQNRREQYAQAFAEVYGEREACLPCNELYNALMDIAPMQEQWSWLCSTMEVVQGIAGTELRCGSLESTLAAREMMGIIHDAVADLEWPLPLTIISLDNQPLRPQWIAPSQWVEFALPLQAALTGSVLNEDGSLDVQASCYEFLMSAYKAQVRKLLR